MKTNFDLSAEQRSQLLGYLVKELEKYYHQTESVRVAPELDLAKIIEAVRSYDLQGAVDGLQALEAVLKGMTDHAVHTPHPMYYGLYNPRANFAGILADLITAVMNPQLAAWSHSPYASEVEKYLIEIFGAYFGYSTDSVDGVFATGGAEANFTALLCALNHAFPQVGEEGVQNLPKSPVIYCSGETHHSIIKGARMAGLGSRSVRLIQVDGGMKMNVNHLVETIEKDRQSGEAPVMVVANAGTTGTGSIDHLERIGGVCREQGIWYHVDAAYGGAIVVNPDFKQWIGGIEMSQSLIFDVHKWFSVPMAASMFITNNPDILHQTFQIHTGYMPGDARTLKITDPFTHSFQWSRRFTGLKLYLSMLIFGVEGYSEVIGTQIETGNKLRKLLTANAWTIVNDSPLPVVCFTDESYSGEPAFVRSICDRIVRAGKAWISVYPLGEREVLRACITNYNTENEHIEKLVKLLGEARESYNPKEQ